MNLSNWLFGSNKEEENSFPNSIRQHKEKLENEFYIQGSLYDDEEYEDYYGWGKKADSDKIEDNMEEYFTPYEIDTMRRRALEEARGHWSNSGGSFAIEEIPRLAEKLMKQYARKQKSEKIKSKKDSDFENKWKSGTWGGYKHYTPQTLSYRYVQQMANALAAQHRINIKIGNEWKCDLTTKTLTYNPTSLIYGTKSELLATLLHEIGKLRYSKSFGELKYDSTGKPISRYIVEYQEVAYNAMLPFEELRVDNKMLSEYGSAAEIYESQEPALQRVYDNYKRVADYYRELTVSVARDVVSDDTFHKQPDKLVKRYNNSKIDEIRAKFSELEKKLSTEENIYDYIAAVYSEAYNLKKRDEFSSGILARVEKTNLAFNPIIKAPDALVTLGEMDKTVYPVIEDLLKQRKEGSDALDEFGGSEFSKEVMDGVNSYMDNIGQRFGAGVDKKGDQKSVRMSSGQTNDTTSPEWFKGEYKPLKDSVLGEIKRLIRLLTFLKRTEQVSRWTDNQRRGKLNMKKLYRAKMGNRRVFKKKLENPDTVRSFVFSIVLDVSGSMNGSRIANTTRGLIILAEVFKHMGIPFEIITFSDGAKVIKKFDDEMDKKIEPVLGGLPNTNGGGTNLDKGLDKVGLKNRPEKNKVCIVLTDGGVGDQDFYNNRYFKPMLDKHNIKSLAFGLEIGIKEIQKLCNNTGRAIANAVEVPYIFADLLKSLIIKKK